MRDEKGNTNELNLLRCSKKVIVEKKVPHSVFSYYLSIALWSFSEE
jgi:hypothetical protein